LGVQIESTEVPAGDLPNTGSGVDSSAMAMNGISMVITGLLLRKRNRKNKK
jgi:LPXTG-motif cell wall-anchored protein